MTKSNVAAVDTAKEEHEAEAMAAAGMVDATTEEATREQARKVAEKKHFARLQDNHLPAKGGYVYVEQFKRPDGFDTIDKVRQQAAKCVQSAELAGQLEGTVLSRLSLVMASALDIHINDVPGANRWLPAVKDDCTPRVSRDDCVALLKSLMFPGKDAEKDWKLRITGGSKSNSIGTLAAVIPVAAKAGVLVQIGKWRLSQPELNNRDVWLRVYDFDVKSWRHIPDTTGYKGKTFQALGGPLSGLEPFWARGKEKPLDMIAQPGIIRATAKHINAQYGALMNGDELTLFGTLKRDADKAKVPTAAAGATKAFVDMSGEEKRTIIGYAMQALLDPAFRLHCHANKDSMAAVNHLAYVVSEMTDRDGNLQSEKIIEENATLDEKLSSFITKHAA